MTQHPLSILLVEDHELSRFGLTAALSDHPHLQVIGEADNGKDGISLALEKKPNVVLMDIGLPEVDGITATKAIKVAEPSIKVIMLTSMSQQEEVLASLAAGADAYCFKDIKMERLCQVIDMVMEGAIWLDPAIARAAMQALLGSPSPKENFQDIAKRNNAGLTEREYEVLRLIVEGKSNKDIAQALNVTAHTAKAHVASILQKFAVTDRTQIAVKALQEGILNR